jgi:hypothetical protein
VLPSDEPQGGVPSLGFKGLHFVDVVSKGRVPERHLETVSKGRAQDSLQGLYVTLVFALWCVQKVCIGVCAGFLVSRNP